MSTYEANRYAFPASAIASGTLADARIPDLATSKITSGTFVDARLSSSSVTQHVDLSNLNASNLTSGSIPNARVPSGAVTQHVSAVTQATGTWSPSANFGGFSPIYATYSRTGNIVTCVANFKYNGNSRSNSDNTVYTMAGLPITPRSASGQQIVGGGIYSFYYSQAYQGIVKINEGSTTINFYSYGADLSTTSYYRTYTDLQSTIPSNGDNGWVITRRNMYQTMAANRWGYLFLVYQV
tara:strand:+ start:195 stop:911 length:717 start_codon:yes stop_codon:yes gene_type:complete